MNDIDWNQYASVNPTAAAEPQSWKAVLTKERHFRYLHMLEEMLKTFSPGERLALYLLSAIAALSALVLLSGVNALASVTVPAPGGSLIEGEVGPARFINPLLTMSQPDQDLSALIYSGLMRALPDGTMAPDLAQSYTISPDGRTYTFKLRPSATFHDGTPVTAADVAYTIQEAMDPNINSPKRADWTGVAVSTPDDHTVAFTLPHAYAPFIQNTTLGILPKHLWENVSAEEYPFSPLNTHPIGSGPYQLNALTTDSTGAASRYDLTAFSRFALGAPYLSHISLLFYPNAAQLIQALNAGKIDAAGGIAPEELAGVKRSAIAIVEEPLPRTFGVFFNQSHDPVLVDSGVRQALEAAIDKEEIVRSVLGGRGQVLNGPFPPELLGNATPTMPQAISDIASASSTSMNTLIANAKAILQKDGWSFTAATTSPTSVWTKGKQTLAFTLATADQPELVATAHAIVADWQQLGVRVSLQVYPLSEINTTVIRPRNYDALLFGEVVGPQLDLYAFWHSSQRSDPGLNLAMYANPHADTLLSQARAATDKTQRDALYTRFSALLAADHPAIFLYAPDFLYIVPNDIYGVELGAQTVAADRFENVYRWYTDTESVWKIFAPQDAITNNS